MGTKLTYECPARRHYFGFDKLKNWANLTDGEPNYDPIFVSYFYTTNVRYINVTCTKDRWVNVMFRQGCQKREEFTLEEISFK